MTDTRQIAAALASDANFIARLAEAVAKRLDEKASQGADGGQFPEVAQ